jgi:hypothetical protein
MDEKTNEFGDRPYTSVGYHPPFWRPHKPVAISKRTAIGMSLGIGFGFVGILILWVLLRRCQLGVAVRAKQNIDDTTRNRARLGLVGNPSPPETPETPLWPPWPFRPAQPRTRSAQPHTRSSVRTAKWPRQPMSSTHFNVSAANIAFGMV